MILKLIRAEPVMFVALVNAVLALLLAFGVPLTLEQIAAVIAVVEIVLGLIVRAAVVPVRELERVIEGESLEQLMERHSAERVTYWSRRVH